MRRFLVLGHGRSGTKYMAALLGRFGYDVGHERMGKHGTSCWSWSTYDPDAPWSPTLVKRGDFEFTDTLHAIRHPLLVISSTLHSKAPAASYRAKYTVQFPEWRLLDNLAMAYLGWFNLIEAQGPDLTLRVEDAPQVIASYLGVSVPVSLPSTDLNSRGIVSQPINLDLFRPEVAAALERFCVRFGYPIEVVA